MKDGKFETHAEIYQALLDGKKIRLNTWADVYYLYLEKGMLKDERGEASSYHFEPPCNWSIYEEPKPKKKVTLYRYTYVLEKGCDRVKANKGEIFQTEFTDCSFSEYDDGYGELLLTESKEIEVDDV